MQNTLVFHSHEILIQATWEFPSSEILIGTTWSLMSRSQNDIIVGSYSLYFFLLRVVNEFTPIVGLCLGNAKGLIVTTLNLVG